MAKESKFNRKSPSPFSYFLALILVNVVLMALAGIFYNGHFDFLRYPLSDLGATLSQTGLPNTFSSHIYSLNMFLNGAILFLLANHFRKFKPDNGLLPLLCFLGGSGAVIAGASPDNIQPVFHDLGSALLVAALWLLATTNIYAIRKRLGKTSYLFLQIAVLQIPIIAYALTFFMRLPLNDILQKPALLGLAAILLYSTLNSSHILKNFSAS